MSAPWYKNGLNFSCLWPECTACCGGEPGYVWVTPERISLLAAHLDVTVEAFREQYVTMEPGRVGQDGGPAESLCEKEDGDCIFLGPEGCTVYPVRPPQCGAYPFWPEILHSLETWETEALNCPGMNHGPLIPLDEIEARSQQKRSVTPAWRFD